MKRILFITCLAIAANVSLAQSKKDSSAPYMKVPYVPPFEILLTDSTWFAKKDLPKKKQVVVMYFSPDCSHCQLQVKDITDNMKYFEETFFVFAAYKNLPEIVEFSEKYKLAGFKNIKIGRDTAYFLPTFYRVKFTPFIGVYNKDGKLIESFDKGATVDELKKLLYINSKKKPAGK